VTLARRTFVVNAAAFRAVSRLDADHDGVAREK
jgi:hypothetical protein